MPSYNKYVNDFIKVVCSEVRFKSMHLNISKELSDHIEDQKNVYVQQGLPEEAATIKAVEQMGDPILVGKQLNKAHSPKTEWSILTIVSILVVLGGALQYLLSGVNPHYSHMFSRFLVYAPFGIGAFAVMYFFDYTLFARYSKPAYFVILVLTIARLVSTNSINGSFRHVYYSNLLFIPVFAGIVYGFRKKGYLGIMLSGLFYLGSAIPCLLANLFSSFLLLSLSCLIILTVAIGKGFFGVNKKVSLSIVYFTTIFLIIASLLPISNYRRARLIAILNPEIDSSGSSYLSLMIRRLLTNAKPVGTATLSGDLANKSIDKLLPTLDTNLSLTYIIAQFGYVFALALVTIMIILIVRMFISVVKQKNAYAFLVAFSACLAITEQIVFYFLMNLAMIPLFPITFPFISFGASSFILNMGLLGLLLSVYRRTDLVNDKLQNNISNRRIFTFVDGKLIIDLGIKASRDMIADKLD